MHTTIAIWKKQVWDTSKNKTILIQLVLFPVITVIMNYAVKMEDMPELSYLKLFSIMYLAMAPITSMSAIISEEKEKGTLRALMMSYVRPWEYLLGVGAYVFCCCTIGTVFMSKGCGMEDPAWTRYMAVMAVGMVISILLGAAIGMWSKDQMSATSLQVPVMCVFSFLPMIAQFNDQVARVAKFFYTQQLYNIVLDIENVKISMENVVIIGANALLILVFFFLAYRKEGLSKD